jgi:hypothetical protein
VAEEAMMAVPMVPVTVTKLHPAAVELGATAAVEFPAAAAMAALAGKRNAGGRERGSGKRRDCERRGDELLGRDHGRLLGCDENIIALVDAASCSGPARYDVTAITGKRIRRYPPHPCADILNEPTGTA